MCNTRRDPNNENKRKAIALVEPDVETKNSKSPNNGDVGEAESTNSSKEISPFLLFGFIVDPNKRIKHAYSCNFCSRKFINPQALGGHQNCHRVEKRLKESAEGMNKYWINYSNGTQRVVSQNTIIPYHGRYGYQYNGYENMIQLAASSNFDVGNLLGKVEYDSVSSGGADSDDVDHEDNVTPEEKESKIDFTLKL
ncbi:hypothetical protein TSUD_166310 [Trifolium subterraneum]|uniref:C2H2-type domain-containing protein n=1 Tax=Trifolium subterraneum TaxID=3900 RepID=A0A2Z6NKR2_TRISU|nr:hypothetical protein TSUD_166310 [Trifolium subterraneum]